MKNIALVGFMGTGKTTVAGILARRLKVESIELDALIEKAEKMKIADIFTLKGEPYFRDAEKNAVKNISLQASKIISCGGGVVLTEENIINLKKNGVLVCLWARPEVILKRTEKYKHRPLLNVPDPSAKIKELLELRKPFYAKADFSVDTSDLSPEEVAEKIIVWAEGKI